jgi:hypothetical protein
VVGRALEVVVVAINVNEDQQPFLTFLRFRFGKVFWKDQPRSSLWSHTTSFLDEQNGEEEVALTTLCQTKKRWCGFVLHMLWRSGREITGKERKKSQREK